MENQKGDPRTMAQKAGADRQHERRNCKSSRWDTETKGDHHPKRKEY